MTDRDRLLELIDNVLQYLPWGEVGTHTSKDLADYLFENGVIVQKKGKWVSAPIKEKGYDSKTIPTCTNCGYQSFITYTYCPGCGTKLKECEGK